MNKNVLSEYLDALAVIEDTEKDLARLKMEYETNSVDSVKGSNPEFPYEPRVFRIEGVSYRDYRNADEIKKVETILLERKANAKKLRMEVDLWMNTIPSRIQRIVRMRFFMGMTWENISRKLGYTGNSAARMELDRFLKKNCENESKSEE